jgi:transcriptional regulator with XRE-family HTH domain
MGRVARPKPKRLAEKLLQIRVALDLSQNGMLKLLGLDEKLFRSAVSGYELGTREPPLTILLEYARAAGVCVDVLIDDRSNLPKKLPSMPKHEGLTRSVTSQTKQKS